MKKYNYTSVIGSMALRFCKNLTCDWEVTEASVRSGLTAFYILSGRTYCHFSYNTAKFSREEISYTLSGTPEGIKTVPAGEYAYAVKEGTITIDNQIFTVSALSNDTTLVLENEGCKLVLVGKGK